MADRAGSAEGDFAVAGHRHRPLGLRAAPDVVPSTAPNAFATVRQQVPLKLAQRSHRARVSRTAPLAQYPTSMELHVVFEPDEEGWVRASIEELPGVISCAPTHDEARELIRDALAEWLAALTSSERAAISAEAIRETLTLSVA
ncbi:MAG TPA: type II toxin-antitoxin system HicB family antitoxin [Verrucomicrobiae bacterium]|nr:type II toxin-antitoxin system HicB family antitoxin [Verrucomicrobiae bacterium]